MNANGSWVDLGSEHPRRPAEYSPKDRWTRQEGIFTHVWEHILPTGPLIRRNRRQIKLEAKKSLHPSGAVMYEVTEIFSPNYKETPEIRWEKGVLVACCRKWQFPLYVQSVAANAAKMTNGFDGTTGW